jgi:hypothetical protein
VGITNMNSKTMASQLSFTYDVGDVFLSWKMDINLDGKKKLKITI